MNIARPFNRFVELLIAFWFVYQAWKRQGHES